MIKVIRGDEEKVIPAGAYKMFASAGWQKAENSESHDDTGKSIEPPTQEPDLGENPDPEADPEQGKTPEQEGDPEEGEAEGDGDEDDGYEEIEVDPEELLEKPVGDLDYEELQIVAEYLGLDVENLTTLKALRKAIKEAQN